VSREDLWTAAVGALVGALTMRARPSPKLEHLKLQFPDWKQSMIQ
jgi:hypothetical protein